MPAHPTDPSVVTADVALEAPSMEEIEALLSATGDAWHDLLARAAAARDAGAERAGRPRVITYSRKVFIPLTTLCRDRCHYCTFVDTPGQLARKGESLYMSPAQVLTVARRGARMGCKEALFTLGDRPEERWPEARAWLDDHGFASTLDYMGAMARLVHDETGLLPHLNPGVMSLSELTALRPVAASMGMMLETTSRELFEVPGMVHFGSPDKDPAVRLAVIDDAGRAGIPFTTGILVGIGETVADRAASLLAIRDAHARWGHVQEVIVQNFRAKPGTAMRGAPDADLVEYAAAIATARLVLGPDMRIQVPPNLSDPREFELLLSAGADDWGGVSPLTPDHVNPERAWPQLDDLARRTAEAGFRLEERLTIHPGYAREPERWLDPAMRPAVSALRDPATDLARAGSPAPARPRGGRSGGAADALARAADDPDSLSAVEWTRLLGATGSALDDLAALADDVRRHTVGESVGLVANRNVDAGAYRSDGADHETAFDLDDLARIAADAAALGLTELCIQGRIPAAEDPDAYLAIARTVADAAPGIHLHAFRPADVVDFADRSGIDVPTAIGRLRRAGVATMPGTGVKILSERVRALVAPDDLAIDRWREVMRAGHAAGHRGTTVMVYGGAETLAERVDHLRELRDLQRAHGGVTEVVLMPHPVETAAATPGRSRLDEHRATFAVARLMLSETIRHLQVPWPRMTQAEAVVALRSGGDDLGGTLLDGRVLPRVGAESGRSLPPREARRLVAGLFRPLRQRSTTYGDVRTIGFLS